MRHRFVEAVERIVGRRVLGFTSQILVTKDVAVEMFVLEAGQPAAGGVSSRTSAPWGAWGSATPSSSHMAKNPAA